MAIKILSGIKRWILTLSLIKQLFSHFKYDRLLNLSNKRKEKNISKKYCAEIMIVIYYFMSITNGITCKWQCELNFDKKVLHRTL
jgi:hypothetical protein